MSDYVIECMFVNQKEATLEALESYGDQSIVSRDIVDEIFKFFRYCGDYDICADCKATVCYRDDLFGRCFICKTVMCTICYNSSLSVFLIKGCYCDGCFDLVFKRHIKRKVMEAHNKNSFGICKLYKKESSF